jgi:alkanesulfonate monooxygenase SsuD/methylene tetrahydromethanopterin reductase-like flavin-dependent oxidoreductase (luciferase family)
MTVHLAAALDEGSVSARHYVELTQLAERAGLDFVTLDDTWGLDPVLVLARVAPTTSRIGLVPTVTTTHTEPFHVSKSIATLDHVSLGRAGWRVKVSTTRAEADLFGRKPAAGLDELYREAGEVVAVVRGLWDSWEDDAEIRDVATGRFIDRDKLHYVDYTGEFFSVKGPSIVPRSPQGQPIVAVSLAHGQAAALDADIVFGRPEDRETLPQHVKLFATAETPRDVIELAESGLVDGIHVRGIRQLVDEVVPVLRERGLISTDYRGRTLREHLGLPAKAANRYAGVAR